MKRESLKEEKITLTYNFTDYPYPHTHNFWEFTLITDGTIMHKINDTSLLCNKNTLLVLRPEDRHMFLSISPKSSHINFTVPLKTMRAQLQLLLPEAYNALIESEPITLELSELNSQRIIQKALKAESIKNSHGKESKEYECHLSQLFLIFIDELFYRIFINKGNFQPNYNFLPEHLKNVIALLNDVNNFSLNLQDILKQIPYSYIHISKSFKQYMQMTLSDYFLTIKMNYAKLLLEKGNTSILSIAETIGYTKQSHFNLAFKNFFQLTPLQYKKNWQDYYSNLEDDDK
ncbi:MAG: helix-turn-helix domain-containing protein [Clostridia bacterium]|nr:helix-turn-helix domain-containing protein [Clostridia bacterium]